MSEMSDCAKMYIITLLDGHVRRKADNLVPALLQLFYVADEHPRILSHGRDASKHMASLQKRVSIHFTSHSQVAYGRRCVNSFVVSGYINSRTE